jgi:hypothetical protein
MAATTFVGTLSEARIEPVTLWSPYFQIAVAFEDYRAWHQFTADGTLDIERRQP